MNHALAAAGALLLAAAPAQGASMDPPLRYAVSPNLPLTEALPLVANAQPGDGLKLASGSRPAFSLIMGSGQANANMTTGQSVRDRFFLTYAEGDLTRAIGSPMDTGQANNAAFAAVARQFPTGDPNDLHVMASDGLHLRAVCARERSDCSPGHVWGGMIRLPFAWRPGTVVKVRYRSPAGPHSWAPIWMFSGEQVSPGPHGNPYRGFGTPRALYRPASPGHDFEIDWNDNYPRQAAGVPTGRQIDFGTPDIYNVSWRKRPHPVYWANGDGWRYYGPAYKPEFAAAPFDWSAGFHDLVGNWRGDGSNLIDLFVDGKLVVTSYMEYPQESYVDPATGKTQILGMHLIIGNQAIPSFAPGAATARDNDGITDGWTIVVQEISGWYGGIADPEHSRASQSNGIR